MRLREPITGTAVEAEGQAAEMLFARGFIAEKPKAEEAEKPKKTKRKKA